MPSADCRVLSTHPLPHQVPRLASLCKAGDFSIRSAQKHFAIANLARHEQHVGDLGAYWLWRPSSLLSLKRANLFPDLVDDLRRQRIAAHVFIHLLCSELDTRRIGSDGQNLTAQQTPALRRLDPCVSNSVLTVQLVA